jgi:hypothetical protein
MNPRYEIREVDDRLHAEALRFLWRIFLECEAPDASEPEIGAIKDFIRDASFSVIPPGRTYRMWACFDGEEIVGAAAHAPAQPTALLFVDDRRHERYVVHSLFRIVRAHGKNAAKDRGRLRFLAIAPGGVYTNRPLPSAKASGSLACFPTSNN